MCVNSPLSLDQYHYNCQQKCLDLNITDSTYKIHAPAFSRNGPESSPAYTVGWKATFAVSITNNVAWHFLESSAIFVFQVSFLLSSVGY